jgi:hypothetical protein
MTEGRWHCRSRSQAKGWPWCSATQISIIVSLFTAISTNLIVLGSAVVVRAKLQASEQWLIASERVLT